MLMLVLSALCLVAVINLRLRFLCDLLDFIWAIAAISDAASSLPYSFLDPYSLCHLWDARPCASS